MNKEEIWKPIKDYEELYMVSSNGRVKSLDKKVKNNHNTFSKRKGKILKSYKNKAGYLLVALSKENKRKQFLVSRLVAQAFKSNPNNLSDVNHIDFNLSNNNIDNLEWVNHKENVNHSSKNGRMKRSDGFKEKCKKRMTENMLLHWNKIKNNQDILERVKSGKYE